MVKVLIYSPNTIGKTLAGTGIRAWEFAKCLSRKHQVVLVAEKVEIQSSEFEIVSLQEAFKKHFREGQILITQRLTLPLSLCANHYGFKVVIDAYDPYPLELLEAHKHELSKENLKKINAEISSLNFSFKFADGVICASERQRQLWIGYLLSQKLITPHVYEKKGCLRHFLEVVPFGLSSQSPQKSGSGLRELFQFKDSDKVLLWGGGIWKWFDPLTLIRAMHILYQKRQDIKLVFMGVKLPVAGLSSTTIGAETIKLATELNLLNQGVFFHQEWIPYDQRQNFLLDADIGVSTHFDHLETLFSFRTRMLDYIWAELPILATQGDSFADLIEQQQLGKTVPYRDARALAKAIVELVDHPQYLLNMKQNLKKIKANYYWEEVLKPLEGMIQELTQTPRAALNWQNKTLLLKCLFSSLVKKGPYACLKKLNQIIGR